VGLTFSVTIPGQPKGINRLKVRRNWRSTATGPVSYPSIGKDAQTEQYQDDVTVLVRNARPSGWKWDGGFVRTVFRFHFGHDQDVDNSVKVIHDGIAAALGINDTWFLPTVVSKESGVKAPFVEITIGAAMDLCPCCGKPY
jgi:Holliday junction resolvase RusA-like endonuclease